MQLTPEWIVGFVDGDGGFNLVRDSNGFTRFIFSVSQDKRSIHVLYAIKKFFGCGRVTSAGGNMAEFRVDRKEHLENVIFPFFDQYPLQTVTKKNDKETLFTQWTEFHSQKQTVENISLYDGPRLNLKNPVNRCLYQTEDWLAGFIDAEGCFIVSMFKNNVRPQLVLGSDEKNLPLLQNLVKHYKIGTVYQRKDGFAIFQVNKLNSDLPRLFQLLKSPPNDRLHTVKKIAYGLFLNIVTIWNNKQPKRLKYKEIPNGEAYRDMLSNLNLDSSPKEGLPPEVESRRKLIVKILQLRLNLNKFSNNSILDLENFISINLDDV
nr:hypothetical protein [Microspora sp. UTEX LB472]